MRNMSSSRSYFRDRMLSTRSSTKDSPALVAVLEVLTTPYKEDSSPAIDNSTIKISAGQAHLSREVVLMFTTVLKLFKLKTTLSLTSIISVDSWKTRMTVLFLMKKTAQWWWKTIWESVRLRLRTWSRTLPRQYSITSGKIEKKGPEFWLTWESVKTSSWKWSTTSKHTSIPSLN